jgi:hypothetical protein
VTLAELRNIAALNEVDSALALSYRQVVYDLAECERLSYRGTAVELRELLKLLANSLAEKVLDKDALKECKTLEQKLSLILTAREVQKTEQDGVQSAAKAVEARANAAVAKLGLSANDKINDSVHNSRSREDMLIAKQFLDVTLQCLLAKELQSKTELPTEFPGAARQQFDIWCRRSEWWLNIPLIIEQSSKLVVIESYFSSHHEFWNALETAFKGRATI